MVSSHFLPLHHLRSSMPDQTRCFINATVSSLSDSINVNKNISRPKQSEARYISITDAVLQNKVGARSSSTSPKVIRRYSKPQGESCDSDSENQIESSVDGEHHDDILLLRKFQNSVNDSRCARRRSSPDLKLCDFQPSLGGGIQVSTSINNNSNTSTDTSSDFPTTTAIASASSTRATVDLPQQRVVFPRQNSILSKMVGSRITPNTQQQVDNSPPSSSSSSSSLIPSKSCPKFHTFDDNYSQPQYIDIYSVESCSKQSGTMLPSLPKSSLTNSDSCKCDKNSDSVDSSSISSSSSSGFGFFSKTRQFGTWLGLSADGAEKVEISKKDLNVFAPTTF